jgi:serine/threonine protein kinase
LRLRLTGNRVEMNEKTKISILRQLAMVVNFLHQGKLVHRDLKTQNILIDEYFNMKLCDFGIAREFVCKTFKLHIILKQHDLNKGAMQFGGTPCYMAPEVFARKTYNEKVDIFAFGCIAWEIFAGEVPYDGLEGEDIAKRVLKGDKLPSIKIPSRINEIVNQCRQVDPNARPSAEELYQSLLKN